MHTFSVYVTLRMYLCTGWKVCVYEGYLSIHPSIYAEASHDVHTCTRIHTLTYRALTSAWLCHKCLPYCAYDSV